MITLEDVLKKLNIKIEDKKLLVNIHDKGFVPVHSVSRSIGCRSPLIDYLYLRLKYIKNIKGINTNRLCFETDIDEIFHNMFIGAVKSLQAEINYGLSFGDYVEFNHSFCSEDDGIARGYIKEVVLNSDGEPSTYIVKNQFSFEKVLGNFVINGGVSLKHIKDNLITHRKAELCSDVLIISEELDYFLKNIQKNIAS